MARQMDALQALHLVALAGVALGFILVLLGTRGKGPATWILLGLVVLNVFLAVAVHIPEVWGRDAWPPYEGRLGLEAITVVAFMALVFFMPRRLGRRREAAAWSGIGAYLIVEGALFFASTYGATLGFPWSVDGGNASAGAWFGVMYGSLPMLWFAAAVVPLAHLATDRRAWATRLPALMLAAAFILKVSSASPIGVNGLWDLVQGAPAVPVTALTAVGHTAQVATHIGLPVFLVGMAVSAALSRRFGGAHAALLGAYYVGLMIGLAAHLGQDAFAVEVFGLGHHILRPLLLSIGLVAAAGGAAALARRGAQTLAIASTMAIATAILLVLRAGVWHLASIAISAIMVAATLPLLVGLAVSIGPRPGRAAQAATGAMRSVRDVRVLGRHLRRLRWAQAVRETLLGMPPASPVEWDGTLGRYRIVRWLGSGGTADVYLARDPKHDREVVLKIAHAGARAAAAIEEEWRVLQTLDHPGVVHAYGVARSGEDVVLVMEYVPGGDLAHALERGALDEGVVIDVMVQIAGAIAAVHDAGLVHGDVKPANILVDGEGKGKLADFGLTRGTADGTVKGTLATMPPECARGAPSRREGDVWAWGATLYQLLSGEPAIPTEGLREHEARARVAQGLPADRLERVAPRFHALLARCLALDPAKRHASLRDAQRELVAIGRTPV